MVVLGCAIFLYQHYSHKATYNSKISFMVEGNSGSSGGLSSLLGTFGIKKGGSTSVHKVIEVAKSTKLLSKVLLDTIDTNQLLGNKVINHYSKDKAWLEANPIFKTYRFDAKAKFSKKNSGKALKTMRKLFWKQELGNNFNDIAINNESGIFTLNTRMENENLSYLLNMSIYKNLKYFFELEIFQNQLEATRILKSKADSLKSAGISKSYELARFTDQNYGLLNREDEVRKNILMGEIQAINIAYSEVVKTYELTDFNLKDTQPLFIEIETPYLPLQKDNSSLTHNLLYGIAFGGLLGIMLIIARRLYLDIME